MSKIEEASHLRKRKKKSTRESLQKTSGGRDPLESTMNTDDVVPGNFDNIL